MNNKGQALIEFIIIMPILIMILLVIFDYAQIIQTKMSLESTMEEVVLNKDYPLSEDTTLETNKDGEYQKYTLKKDVKILSPILSAALGNPYKVEVDRSVHE